MLSSGVRPEQSFYDSVRKQETEKTNMYRLNQVAIRMVEMPPLLSDVPMADYFQEVLYGRMAMYMRFRR